MGRKKKASETSPKINQDFPRFLKRLREEVDVSLEQLSKGLMTPGMLARIEKGNRSIYKNARDFLIGRLGVASDWYENLLSLEDYATWELQKDILYAVEQGNIPKAQELLVACGEQKNRSISGKIKRQFCLVMQAELLRQQGASADEIGAYYSKAVRITVPDVDHLCLERRMLSILEVNMILEYEFYLEKGDFAEVCRDLMAFVETSVYDDLSKAKIYPKIVYYYLRQKYGVQERQDAGEPEDDMGLCDRAIEMLQVTGRAYYLLELLETEIRIIQCIEGNPDDDAAQERFKTKLQDCMDMADLLKALYAEYGVPAYMQDCTYLYQQRWMFYVGDVLRIRRGMFGLTQKKLCEGVCSERSLIRAENRESNMQQASLDILLGRVGLSKEFQRARLVSNDREVLKMKEEMAVCRNNCRLDEAREILGQIKTKVTDEIPGNMQFFKEAEASLDWLDGKITSGEYLAREEDALGCTLKVKDLYHMDEVYLTEMELACIRNIQQVLKSGEKRISIDFVIRFFDIFEKKGALSDGISMYEFAIINAIFELGNLKEYKFAVELAKKVLSEDLHCRRIWGIDAYLYELAWNESEQTGKKEKMTGTLKQCLLLSHFCKRTFYEGFYHEKMNHV